VPPARQPGGAPQAAVALGASAEVARVAPVFKLGENRVIATDRVLVGIRRPEALTAAAQAVGATVLQQQGTAYEYVLQLPESVDPFDAADQLQSHPDIDYAEPDLVTVGRHIPKRTVGPNAADPLTRFQYMLKLTQAKAARERVLGDPQVRIAVLDEGVDTAHPDLAAAILGSFDATDDDEFQEPNGWDGHGTACAGLAAAIGDNARGVEGVAAGCSILAVRIAFSDEPGGPWKTSNSVIARAVDWSWQNGASVLSNSWGGGAPSTAITNAFERARTQGRNGLGAVVVIAAGNDNGPVTFPGDLPNLFAVAASNEFDEPKTPTSRDGEFWWGSCFGPEIAVAAPGVHNYTTDISGMGGYNTGGGVLDSDYFDSFNGTSSACPIVAGTAALVLSANPALTEAQVRQVLLESADKVGPDPYVNGRNDRMGHGRVNALRAVDAAIQARTGVGRLVQPVDVELT